MRTAVIFDCDGTLVDVSEIRFHVNPKDPRFSGRKRFDRFHAEAVDCPPNELALQHHRDAMSQGHAIVIVTARKEEWLYHTLLWLVEHDIHYDELFMRANNDGRPDYVTKADILTRIRNAGYDPVLAVDDNPAVLALWQEHGIDTIRIPGWEEQP